MIVFSRKSNYSFELMIEEKKTTHVRSRTWHAWFSFHFDNIEIFSNFLTCFETSKIFFKDVLLCFSSHSLVNTSTPLLPPLSASAPMGFKNTPGCLFGKLNFILFIKIPPGWEKLIYFSTGRAQNWSFFCRSFNEIIPPGWS